MAYTTINKSTAHFNTKLYTGNNGTQAITGVGFAPDLVWTKARNGTNSHLWYDKVRGVHKYIRSDQNGAEGTATNTLTSFDSDGFTVEDGDNGNASGANGVSWNWKAGTTGSGNTGGSGTYKAYSYSVNTTAGFSIIKYVGNGTAGHTIPHHLGGVPEWILVKDLDATVNWQMYHVKTGNDYTTEININNAPFSSNSRWNNTTPSSTVVTLGDGNNTNNNNTNYIMYAFTSKTGYSKFGSYTGNGNADGTFVYTGFKPSFIIIIKKDTAEDNFMTDGIREPYNPAGVKFLLLNNNTAEASSDKYIDFLSNGFKLREATGYHNDSPDPYIYMAFGQSIVGSNNIPCTAR